MEQNDKMKDARRSLNARLLLLAVGIMLVVNAAVSSLRTGLGWLSLADLVTQTQLQGVQTAAEEAPAEEAAAKEAPAAPAEEAAAPESPAEEGAAQEAPTEEAAAQEAPAEEAPAEEATPAEGAAAQEESAEGTEFDIQVFIEEMDRSGLTAGDLRGFGIAYLISAVLEIIVGMICVVFSNRVDKSKITFTAAIILVVWELIFVVYLLLRGGLMLSVLLNSVLLPIVLLWNAWVMRKLAKEDPTRIFAVKPNRAPAKKPAEPAPKKSIRDRVDWASGDRDE